MKKTFFLFIVMGLQLQIFGQIKDAAPVKITYPVPTYSGTITAFQVVMKNFGTDTLTQIPFIIKYNNVTSLDTLNGIMLPGDSAGHTFNLNIILCENELTVISNVTNDANRGNDTIRKQVLGSKLILLMPSFGDDFETNTNCFYSNTGWQRGIPTSPVINTAHSFLNCWKTNLSGYFSPSKTYYLYSPYFDFSYVQNNVYLKFWHFYDTELNGDGCRVRYKIGNGPWLTLGLHNDPSGTNWYNSVVAGVPAWSGRSAGWVQSTFNLSSFMDIVSSTAPVQFRFELTADNDVVSQDGWAIDDFMIDITTVKEEIDVDRTSISFYPNPATNSITFETTVKNLQLQVYNLNGQILMDEKLIDGSNTIDITGYPQGMYFYRLTDEDKFLQSGKFVKE